MPPKPATTLPPLPAVPALSPEIERELAALVPDLAPAPGSAPPPRQTVPAPRPTHTVRLPGAPNSVFSHVPAFDPPDVSKFVYPFGPPPAPPAGSLPDRMYAALRRIHDGRLLAPLTDDVAANVADLVREYAAQTAKPAA